MSAHGDHPQGRNLLRYSSCSGFAKNKGWMPKFLLKHSGHRVHDHFLRPCTCPWVSFTFPLPRPRISRDSNQIPIHTPPDPIQCCPNQLSLPSLRHPKPLLPSHSETKGKSSGKGRSSVHFRTIRSTFQSDILWMLDIFLTFINSLPTINRVSGKDGCPPDVFIVSRVNQVPQIGI